MYARASVVGAHGLFAFLFRVYVLIKRFGAFCSRTTLYDHWKPIAVIQCNEWTTRSTLVDHMDEYNHRRFFSAKQVRF